jgi:cytochrome c
MNNNKVYPIRPKYKTRLQALRAIAEREPMNRQDVDNSIIAKYELGEITRQEMENWFNSATVECQNCHKQGDKYDVAILGTCYSCFDPYYYY